MHMDEKMKEEARMFTDWERSCRASNLNIGPINEALFRLYEDGSGRVLTDQVKQHILRNQH